MKISVLTLFPEMFDGFINSSIIKRAIDKKIIDIEVINIRDYSTLNNSQVDDTPYGGGAGMVMRVDIVVSAINSVKKENSKIILLTPSGKTFYQQDAINLSQSDHLIFVCGHYEGIDERILDYIDYEYSIGDYVLTGGELPSMVMIDTISRLIPGVINKDSLDSESFNDNLLDYPVYTRPYEFEGKKVPDILLSGDHKKIKEYRESEALRKTQDRRPDLLN